MLQTETLKTTLKSINPQSTDIVEAMVTAFENWLKSATISVPSLTVNVDPNTGIGTTQPTTLNRAVS